MTGDDLHHASSRNARLQLQRLVPPLSWCCQDARWMGLAPFWLLSLPS